MINMVLREMLTEDTFTQTAVLLDIGLPNENSSIMVNEL